MQDSATIRTGTGSGMRPLAAAGGLALILRRAIVACGAHNATTQDRIDCADAALALGYPEVARLLYDAAFLRSGFSRSSVRSWMLIAERTGLWPDAAVPTPAPAPSANFALDVALASLRELIAGEAELPPLTSSDADPTTLETLQLPLPSAVAQQPKRELAAPAVADLLARLCDTLRRGDIAALADALEQVRSEVLELPEPDVTDRLDGPIPDLAAVAVLSQLRSFFLLNYDLCWAPFGSPALFAAAAKMEDAALGPYFTSVGRLLRFPQDLFGLIDLASQGADDSASRLQRWLVLLSTHFDHDTRVLLTDEMGDRGLTSALSGMLRATQRWPARGTGLFWTIRDAALDNGQVALAAATQTEIVRLMVTEAREWVVLAEILGTGGAFAAARTALVEAQRLAPLHGAALERMEALETGGFERFHALSGFGSPPWRIALRARHRPSAQANLATG